VFKVYNRMCRASFKERNLAVCFHVSFMFFWLTAANISQAQREVLVDFGLSSITTTNAPQTWNNYTAAGRLDLVDITNKIVGLGITNLTTALFNGGTNFGPTNPQSSLLGLLAAGNATQDFWYASGGNLSLKLTSLNPAKKYTLRLFGSRDASDTRITTYRVTHAIGGTNQDLQTSGTNAGSGTSGLLSSNANDRSIALFTDLLADTNGEIVVTASNKSGTGFAYLNAMQITVNDYSDAARTILLDFGTSNSYAGASLVNPDSRGNIWNGITSGAYFGNLLDTRGTNSGIGFGWSTGVALGSYNGPAGATANPATQANIDATVFDGEAIGVLGVKEAVFDWASGVNVRAEIAGLRTDRQYNLIFFGSAKYQSNATTIYSVYNSTNYDAASLLQSVSLNHQNPISNWLHNSNNVAVMRKLSPSSGGKLFLNFVGSSGTNAGFLNAMAIEEVAVLPVLTSTNSASGTVGIPFNYQIAANNGPTSFSAVGLPAGLINNPATGLISGTPTAATNAIVQISAGNSAGVATTNISILINPAVAPVITSAPSITYMYGSSFNYQIAASGSATAYAATGLPAGLSLNTNTGLISGSLSGPTNAVVQISAINSAGTNTISLVIDATGQEFLVDFGPTVTTNSMSGKVWNNWTNGGQVLGNMVDSSGNGTGYSLAFTTGVTVNTNYGVIPNPAMGVFNDSNVVSDALYVTSNSPTATFKVSGLNKNNAYRFQIFGSRAASEIRTTTYSLVGSNTLTGSLTNSGTDIGGTGTNFGTNVLSLVGAVPDRNGEISVSFTVTQGTFGYLNAMRVTTTNFPTSASPYLSLANRWLDQHVANPEPSNAVLFVGSSSIRRWESLKMDFSDYNVIQRGMGGSVITDFSQLMNDVVVPYKPRAVVIWSGINDIQVNGSTADVVVPQVISALQQITNAVPSAKIFYLGMTRNPGNLASTGERTNANARIASFIQTNGNSNLNYVDLPAFFEAIPVTSTNDLSNTNNLWYYYVDSLHLNKTGYAIWKKQIRSALDSQGIQPDRLLAYNPSAPQAGQTVLIDFGPTDSTNGDPTSGVDERGNLWNNWAPVTGATTVANGERKSGLIDTAGKATGLTLTITGEFLFNGKLNGGLTNLPSLGLGNLGALTAAQDFFYTTSDGLVGGGSDDQPGGFMISGLNPSLTYDLRFLAARSVASTRQTRYEVYGASSNSVTLQSSGAGIGANRGDGNDQTLATLASVRPNSYGDIFVDVSALSQTNAGDVVAYLNAMEIRVVSPYETWARSRGLTPGVNNALVSSNLETFALDGSSMDQASLAGKIRALSSAGSGGQSLNLNFPVRKGAVFSGSTSLSATQDGVTYEVLGSSDLINWNLPVELVSAGDGTALPALSDPSGYEYRKFRIKDASGTMTKGFLKSTVRSAGTSGIPAVAGKASISASSYSAMQGVQLQGGVVGFFDGGDWLKYSGVDFGSGATSVAFSASKSGAGGTVEIRLGSLTGRLIGTFTPQDTGGWGNYREQLAQLSGFVNGVQDVYLVAMGGTGVCNLQSFRFSQYVLAWGDEFNGTTVNTNNWSVTWNGDVANGELQFYTDRTNNISVTNGVLRLTAQRENYTGQGPWMSAPKTTAYTSGMVESLNKIQPQYGKIEASMKIPRGAGLWPAFWMMGVNYFTGAGWPLCGEIDIMEYSGASGGFTSAFHTGSYNYMNGGGGVSNVQGFSLGDYDTAFHVYGIEWTPTRVAFYVDGKIILTADKATMGNTASQWPFDQPFWLKLNLAVGGSYGGDPTSGTFPQTMEVDWVRVYKDQTQ